eukprot:3727951-Rhodomonas_salina.1
MAGKELSYTRVGSSKYTGGYHSPSSDPLSEAFLRLTRGVRCRQSRDQAGAGGGVRDRGGPRQRVVHTGGRREGGRGVHVRQGGA